MWRSVLGTQKLVQEPPPSATTMLKLNMSHRLVLSAKDATNILAVWLFTTIGQKNGNRDAGILKLAWKVQLLRIKCLGLGAYVRN